MAYQKIGDKKGASDSETKLKKIHLPKNLAKKSFLDVGCSQGFFCRAARKRGATHVVGLDHSESAIQSALREDPEGTYRHGDWYSLLEELVREGQTFDVIIHLSAFHYVTDHVRFLALIHQLLKPHGVFILECGIAKAAGGPRYVDHRRTGITLPYTRHVTLSLLQQLLSQFAVRTEGRSVDQAGDSIPRRVFHCHPKRPVALLVGAESGLGKSNLSALIAGHKSVANIKMDYILKDLVTCPIGSVEAAVNAHMQKYKSISNLSSSIMEYSTAEAFGRAVSNLLPTCFDLMVLEGEVFVDNRLKQAVANELIRRGFICWDTKRMFTDEYATLGIAVNAPDSDKKCRFLLSDASIPFLKQVARDSDVRVRPADNIIMFKPKGTHSAVPTVVAWPAGTATRFGAFVRLVGKSPPVEFLFEAIDIEKLPDPTKPFGHVETLAIQSVVMQPDDTYQRVQVDIPPGGREAMLRVTCRLADSEAGELRVLGMLAEPYFAN